LTSKRNLKVIFASGYNAELAGGEIHLRSGEKFLQKPCSPALLLEAIRSTLENSLGQQYVERPSPAPPDVVEHCYDGIQDSERVRSREA
jgi:hypothetical protein